MELLTKKGLTIFKHFQKYINEYININEQIQNEILLRLRNEILNCKIFKHITLTEDDKKYKSIIEKIMFIPKRKMKFMMNFE